MSTRRKERDFKEEDVIWHAILGFIAGIGCPLLFFYLAFDLSWYGTIVLIVIIIWFFICGYWFLTMHIALKDLNKLMISAVSISISLLKISYFGTLNWIALFNIGVGLGIIFALGVYRFGIGFKKEDRVDGIIIMGGCIGYALAVGIVYISQTWLVWQTAMCLIIWPGFHLAAYFLIMLLRKVEECLIKKSKCTQSPDS